MAVIAANVFECGVAKASRIGSAGDSLGVFDEQVFEFFVNLALESAAGLFHGEVGGTEARGLNELAVCEDGFHTVNVVHDAAVMLAVGVARGISDEVADGFARVGVDGEREAVGGKHGVELAESDAGLDMNEAVVRVKLANVGEFFGGDDDARSEVGASFAEARAADGDGERVFFLGELGGEADDFADVGGGLGDGNETGLYLEQRAICGIGLKNRVFIKDVPGKMAVQINGNLIHVLPTKLTYILLYSAFAKYGRAFLAFRGPRRWNRWPL